jgi:chemotaxis protein CheX
MLTSYEVQIEEIAQSIFATMLAGDVVRLDTPELNFREHLLATIQISGESNCSIVLGFSEGAARSSCAAMLQLPPEDIDASDERDVAAEFVNMVGGNLKSLLPGPSFLSHPTVVMGNDMDVEVAGAELAEDLFLACEGGALRLRRFVAAPNDGR